MFTFKSLFIFHRKAIVVPLHSHATKSISIIPYPTLFSPKSIRHSPSDKFQQNPIKTHHSPYPKKSSNPTQNHPLPTLLPSEIPINIYQNSEYRSNHYNQPQKQYYNPPQISLPYPTPDPHKS